MEFNFAEFLMATIIVLLVILAYTYAIFPLLMAMTGMRKRPSPVRLEEFPYVSLIIPAHNEEEVIEQKIENALALDYPNLEIIVASDGSTDRTAELTRQYDKVRLLAFDNRRGKTSVLTDAVNASSGDLLSLCDANVMFQPDALWRMVSHFSDQEVGGVTGDVRLQSDVSSFGFAESLYYRIERSIQLGESNLGSVMGVDGGMYVIRRELFRELPADTVLDDFSISMNVLRSGKKLLYEPTAIADENATDSAMDEYQRRVRIGIGAAQVVVRGLKPRWDQPLRLALFFSHKFLRWISPWLTIALMMAASLLAFFNSIAWVVLAPMLVVLGLALAGMLSSNLRRRAYITVPFYCVLSEIAFAWGTLRGLLFKSSGIWQRTSRQPLLDRREE